MDGREVATLGLAVLILRMGGRRRPWARSFEFFGCEGEGCRGLGRSTTVAEGRSVGWSFHGWKKGSAVVGGRGSLKAA